MKRITEKKKSTTLMIEGNIGKCLITFAIPLIIGNLLQQMYNTVDSIVVGNYIDSYALAAVGSSTSLISLLIGFSQGISVGAGVVVSLFLGAKDRDGVQTAVHTAVALSLIVGAFLSAIGVILTPTLLRWMKTPSEVMDLSVKYLRYYSFGLVFSIMYNMTAGILNAAGNSKRSLFYLAIASVTNIMLDIVFIKIFGFGVEGAAIATDISQALSSTLALLYLARSKDEYHLSFRKIRADKNMSIRITKVGLPAGVQNMVISFSNVLIQSSVNAFGSFAMAGFASYMKIDGFNILPVSSLSMAITTFVGQNYGANRIDRVKKGIWVTLFMALIYTALTGFFIYFFARDMVSLFSDNKEVIDYGVLVSRYFAPFYFLLGIMHPLAGSVRGTGRSVPPTIIILFALCIFRILWIQFIIPLFNTLDAVFIQYPISWALGAIMMVVYTLKAKWLVPANNAE